MKYYDITPTISSRMAVFPGDCEFSRDEVMSFEKGHHLKLSNIKTTLHIGAHADAPNHYSSDGEGIDLRPLDYYLGPCQVIHVKIPRGARILPKDLMGKQIMAERVLFFTGSFPDPNQWNSDFNSLSPELIAFLADRKVKLVGIDTPSIDPEDSKALESHHAVFENDFAVLEGIVLDNIPEGIYRLIALPLKIEGADASPVRAILVENESYPL